MILGNEGYNLYALLLLVVLNIIFINFLIYKSLIVHEITQFISYLSKPESGFNYWPGLTSVMPRRPENGARIVFLSMVAC